MFNSTKNKIQELQSTIEQQNTKIKHCLSKAQTYQMIANNFSEFHDTTQDKKYLSQCFNYSAFTKSIALDALKECTKRYISTIDQYKLLLLAIDNPLLYDLPENVQNGKETLYYIIARTYSEIYDLTKSESYLLESLTNYSLAVKNAPTNIVFLAGRAKALHQLGRYEDANKDIEMIKELFDSSQTNTDQEIAAYNTAEELAQNLALSGESNDSNDTN